MVVFDFNYDVNRLFNYGVLVYKFNYGGLLLYVENLKVFYFNLDKNEF